MYQPVLSRFQSLDPVSPNGVDLLDDNNWFGDRLTRMRTQYGDGRGMSGYSYAQNNPLRFIDPSGERVFDCVKHFPPLPYIFKAGGKIGPKCKPENWHEKMFQCMIDTLVDPDDFSKCMEKACGPGSYKSLIVDTLCEWIALVCTCTHFEANSRTYNPCQCGIDTDAGGTTVRKCKSPSGGDKFYSDKVCQECCDFTMWVQGIKNNCDVIKKGGKFSPIDVLMKALESETPSKCYENCADCPTAE